MHGTALPKVNLLKKCAALLWQNEFIKKVHGAALAKVNLLKKCAALFWRK